MADIAGLTMQAFVCGVQGYAILTRAFSASKTSSVLFLQLRIELSRFQLWGHNSGLSKGELHERLLPHAQLILDILMQVLELLEDSNRLQEQYGLQPTPIPDSNQTADIHPNRKPAMTIRKAALLVSRFSGLLLEDRELQQDLDALSTTEPADLSPDLKSLRRKLSTYKKFRWAVKSEQKFLNLIEDLRAFTNALNNLLRESQQLNLEEEWQRLQIGLLAKTNNTASLGSLENAAGGKDGYSQLQSMARNKRLVLAQDDDGDLKASQVPPNAIKDYRPIPVYDFDFPTGYTSGHSRVLCTYNDLTGPVMVLLEKKTFEQDISTPNETKLRLRLERLLQLLGATFISSSTISTLEPMGYIASHAHSCYWIVFRLPPRPAIESFWPIISKTPTSLVSLTDYLEYSEIHKSSRPPLENRIQLAASLAKSFSAMLSSQWLHKGVSSANILFVGIAAPVSLEEFFIAGFHYAREVDDISGSIAINDRSGKFVDLYRHPRYQGAGATGYKTEYDIYSIGLLLLEIVWWRPLEALWPKSKQLGGGTDGLRQPTGKEANAKQMAGNPDSTREHIGKDMADKFVQDIRKRVKWEAGYYIGTKCQKALLWCLSLGFVQDDGSEVDRSILLTQFYSQVVVPLCALEKGLAERSDSVGPDQAA